MIDEKVGKRSTDGRVLTREKAKYSKKTLSHWHFGKHKFHMDLPVIEFGPPWQEIMD
jgi:hypothetical protein